MSVDANAMLERLKDLNEKKNLKGEYEKRKKEEKILNDYESAYKRLEDVLDDDRLFNLLKVYWLLDENGTTYEGGRRKDEKTYFTEIQNTSLTSYENQIFFHPRSDKKANIKMCEYHDVIYESKGSRYGTRAETVLQLDYDEDGNYRPRFNCWYERVDEHWGGWHDLPNDDKTKIIKTKMLNNFCDRLPEFMEEVENVFNEFMHDQEMQYGDEEEYEEIKNIKLDDFIKAYELYHEKMDGEHEKFEELVTSIGEVNLFEFEENNIIYEANYNFTEEKLKYYKRGELLGEEDYSLGDVTKEVMKGYDNSVSSTHYYDELCNQFNSNLKFVDTCEIYFRNDNEEYIWNDEKTRLFKCYAPLSEDEKSLLLENADKKDIHDDGLVHIVYDSYDDGIDVLFDIVKQYGEQPEQQSEDYTRMLSRINQGVKL